MDDPENALVERLAAVGSLVEIGVGERPTIARRLADRGVDVTVTDVDPKPVPESVRFVVDDVTEPTLAVYEAADVIFARNLPPELHHPARAVAREVDAAFWFTTLGGDQPAVPVEREQLPGGETLYRATDRDSKALE